MALFVAISAAVASAQSANADFVKVLPAKDPGKIKFLYALKVESPVKVKIYDGRRIMFLDRIDNGPYPEGVSRIYDVKSLARGTFWLEVSSPEMELRYMIVPDADGRKFSPYLETVTYTYQPMVKADN